MLGPHPERAGHSLYDYKDIKCRLHGLSDDELKQIPVLPEGSRLEQGTTYLDLRDANAQLSTVRGSLTAGHNSLLIPKAGVSYVLWNQLIGVDNPARLDEATGGEPPVTERA